MAKRRTSGVQRRERASSDALNRRLDDRPSSPLADWRILAIGGVLIVGAIIVVLVVLFGSGPNPNEGRAQPDDGRSHVTVGIDCRRPAGAEEQRECGEEPYSSVPAASGPHWDPSGIAQWGVYSSPQVETQLIHNLEHGGIVIWYDPSTLNADQVAELTRYVTAQVGSGISGRYKFILSPWGEPVALPAPVVVTAWRYVLELDGPDTGAIDDFVRSHYGQAPEPNGGPPPPG
jgi:hypothetical protein